MAKILARSKTGEFKRLILNESIILLNIDDEIIFELSDKIINTKLIIVFSNTGEKIEAATFVSGDGRVVTLTLFKWNDFEYENIFPNIVSTKAGNKVYIKFKSTSSTINNFRTFHICVWVDELIK